MPERRFFHFTATRADAVLFAALLIAFLLALCARNPLDDSRFAPVHETALSGVVATGEGRGKIDITAADAAGLMAREGKNNLLRFSIRQDKLSITSNSEMGDVYEEMDVETTGSDIDIAFNVRYITDAVKSIDEEQFLIKLNSNISPCVLVPTEGEDFLYLVLPVRTAG